VRLIARDAAGNCQAGFTEVLVHTADNVPPVTLGLHTANVGGTTADLAVQLDETGIAYYTVFPSAGTAAAPCPSAADVFAGVAPPGGGINGHNALVGRIAVPTRAPDVAFARLEGLTSETAYTVCVVAEDATQRHNRQTTTRFVNFITLDVTPPNVTVAFEAGTDGDLACSRAPPYTCTAAWVASLSEPGLARWALVINNTGAPLPVPLPTPAALFEATNASALFPGVVVAEGSLAFPPSPSELVTLSGLPSKTAYALLLAPRDAAAPATNMPAALRVHPLIAPDVTPPVFLDAALATADDDSLQLELRLDEHAATHYVLTVSPSSVPSIPEMQAGVAAGGAHPLAIGNVSSLANITTQLAISGLNAGVVHDLYLWAVDAAGNQQPGVTALK
jgi:hypothetical protein